MHVNHMDVELVHGAWADGSSWSKVILPHTASRRGRLVRKYSWNAGYSATLLA